MNQVSSPARIAVTRCIKLTGVIAGVWLAMLLPAWWLAGADGLEGLSYAALLCLVPGVLVFCLSARYRVAEIEFMVVVLGGMFLRLVFVLGGMFAVQGLRPGLGFRAFVLWLLVFYMTALLVETLLVLREQQTRGDGEQVGSA